MTFEFSRFNAEVRRYALAAVILEEWLQELAAIGKKPMQFNEIFVTDMIIFFCNKETDP